MKESFSETMDTLSALDKQILVERHLISREHAAQGVGSGVVFNREETLCFMINEEDHLRMQALRPGLAAPAGMVGHRPGRFGPREAAGLRLQRAKWATSRRARPTWGRASG